jgi:putative oxidoreductase
MREMKRDAERTSHQGAGIRFVCQLVLGGVFILASLPKIAHPSAFAEAIGNYGIVPSFALFPMAITLAFTELVFGALVVMDIWTRISTAVLGLLLIVFIIALLSAIIRGLNIECGCFWDTLRVTKTRGSSLWITVLRDVLLLVPAYILFARRK